VPVGLVELGNRRAHDPREVKEAYAVADGPRGKRVPHGVDTPVLDSGGLEGGSPMPVAELREVEVAAAGGREEEGGAP
jgi:hypothetical protein